MLSEKKGAPPSKDEPPKKVMTISYRTGSFKSMGFLKKKELL